MTLEYYINYSVFSEKYNIKHYPRIIYPLKSKKSDIDRDLLNEIEIDGAFLVEKDFKIEDKDFPFIFQHFLSFNNSNKLYKCNEIKFQPDLSGKEFKKNDLCLLGIKTNFPDEENDGNPFDYTLEKMLEKMLIFEQLFRELKVNYKRIRLILFYDLVKKINYGDVIKDILENFAKNYSHLDYIDKICFQVIYVNSFYFVESLISNSEKINILIKEVKDLKEEIKKRDEKILKLELENNKLQIENSNLLKMIYSQNEELKNIQKINTNLIHNFELKMSIMDKKWNLKSTSNDNNSKNENKKE
jgi:predicted hydrocarbon binding protein